MGVDVGGTCIKVAIVSEKKHILEKTQVDTPSDCSLETLCRAIYDASINLLKAAQINLENITKVGVGVPGTVDFQTHIVNLTNIGLKNVDIAGELFKKFSKPVFIENDARCALLGECTHNPKLTKKGTLVFFTLGTGLGYSVVVDNIPRATEGGHTVIDFNSKRQCGCGRFGCFETYASATGLVKTAKEIIEKHSKPNEIDLSKPSDASKNIFTAYRAQNPIAKEIIDKYIQHLICGIVNAQNTFLFFGSSITICLGGGISEEGQLLLDLIQEGLQNQHYMGVLNVKIAYYGNDSGMIGATCLS